MELISVVKWFFTQEASLLLQVNSCHTYMIFNSFIKTHLLKVLKCANLKMICRQYLRFMVFILFLYHSSEFQNVVSYRLIAVNQALINKNPERPLKICDFGLSLFHHNVLDTFPSLRLALLHFLSFYEDHNKSKIAFLG